MVVIKKLKFDNMFSYGTGNAIELDQVPVLQLVGSNGAGKSSIPTILEELLYNKNSRGVKKADIKNRYVDDNYYSGTVEFSVGNDEYVLTKIVKATTKLTLTKNGEDVSGHTATQTYKLIENEILMLDFTTFSKLVYQSMNSSLDFLKATDSNRKKFLISLLSLDKYVEIHETIKAGVKEAKADVDKHSGSISTIESMISSYPKKQERKEVPKLPPEANEELLEQAAKIKAYLQDVDKTKKLIERHNKLLSQLRAIENETIEEVKKPTTELETLRKEKQEILLKSQALQREIGDVKSNIRDLESGTGSCKSCGQKLPSAESNKAKIGLETEKLLELQQKANSLETTENIDKEIEKHTVFNKYQQKLSDHTKRYNQAKENLDSLGEVETDITSDYTMEDYNSLKTTYNNQVDDYKTAQKLKTDVELHNSKVDTKNEQLETNTKKLAEAKALLNKATEKLNLLKVLQDAFGPKGLVQYKIESNIKVFEGLINEYLVMLSNGEFNIRFVIEDSKLQIQVFQHGEEINMNSASSGEFNNINTATLLAVRKLMSSISKVSINLLMLDEVISVLDVHARENLIDILIKEKDLNSVVVSHGFEHPLAESLSIVKDGKISKCERG